MEISKSMQDAINRQMNRELYSAYLYLSMAAYFDNSNLSGFSHWMRKQAEEEKGHAMRMYKYVVERGGRVKLAAIEAPQGSWKSPIQVFSDVYKHECRVTGMINKLSESAEKEKDRATQVFLQWFITEQVEEEDSASAILQKLKMIGGKGNGLIMLDKELSMRE